MKMILTLALLVNAGFAAVSSLSPVPQQLPGTHIEIVNVEERAVQFFTRCGSDGNFDKQQLKAGEKAEYKCDGPSEMQVRIKTKIPNEKRSDVVRTLNKQSRNELFWDKEKRRYDIRPIQ
jgi:hypothetical protein